MKMVSILLLPCCYHPVHTAAQQSSNSSQLLNNLIVTYAAIKGFPMVTSQLNYKLWL